MRNQSLFIKMVIYGCILCIIPVVIVGGFSYMQASKEVQKQVHHGKQQYIQQMHSNIEQILVTVNYTLNNFVESSTLIAALDSELGANEFKLHAQLRAAMSRLHSFYTKVQDVAVISVPHNWIVKNSGKYDLEQYRYYDRLMEHIDQPYNTTWVITHQSTFIGEQNDPMGEDLLSFCDYNISLVKQLPMGAVRAAQKTGLAFVNIPVCDLADVIHYDENSEEVMIVNSDFEIMVHVDLDMVGKSLMDTGYFTNFEQFSNKNDQFNIMRNGEAYTITYSKSDLNDWIYISATSLDALNKEAQKIGWLTLYICLIIISLSIIYIWFMSRRIYSPVNNLVNFIKESEPNDMLEQKSELQIINEQFKKLFSSNTRLESELQQHSQQVRSLFLSRLYSGSLKSSEIDESLAYFGFDHKMKDWSTHTVFTLQIDTLDNTRFQPQDYELLLYAVTNIIEETVPDETRLPSVWLDQTLVCVVGSSNKDEDQYNKDILQLSELIQSNIIEYLNLSVSIGVSLPYKDIKKSFRAYQEGLEALKHRIKLGKGVIIHFSSIHSGKHSIVYNYPNDIETDLLDSIKVADKEKAIDYLSQWKIKAFSNHQSVREYQISMIRLLNHLLIVQQEAGISYEQINVQNESLYEELLSLQMSEDIEQWFKTRLVLPLVDVFNGRRDSQYHNLSEEIIHMIQKYYDTDITLEECASKLHYNANYLSSVFKKETGHTFSEYLTIYRLKLGKQWLAETDMTVKEIAEKLRYNNPQNYIRSFRKQEGMTPGQYRTKYGENK